MTETNSKQYSKNITLFEFLIRFIPFMVRIPSVVYHLINGFKMIGSQSRMSWGGVLETTASKFPGHFAIKSLEGNLTYQELNEKANQFAHFLKSRNVQKGDTVTVCVDTRPELLILLCGCAKIGAVCSLVNVNQRGDSLIHSFNLNPGKVIIIGEECYDFVKPLESTLQNPHSFLGYIKDPLIGKLQEENDITDLLPTLPFDNPPETKAVIPADRLAYVYTSGTTGLPKAAVITNSRALSGMFWWGRIVTPIKPRHTVYVPLPFFHTNAVTIGWPMALFSGAAVGIRRKFSASGFLDDVRKFQATHFVYVGEVCRYLMAQPDQPGQNSTSLKYVFGNGLRPDIWKQFKKRYGIKKIFEFYGAAEGVGVFTNILNFDYTVGMSLTSYAIVKYDIDNDCVLLDDTGSVSRAELGEPGLLIMKTSDKTPFAGYSDKQKTEEKILRNVFKEGDMWFNTGDMIRNIGFRQVQFVDRLGDTFRWKGENVATTEVEKVFNQFPGIDSTAVYGVSMPSGDGKSGMAAIILEKDANPDLTALTSHLRKKLPKYAIPLFIRFIDDFEWTVTHKVKKVGLKTQGYDPDLAGKDIYVLLPGTDSYVEMNEDVYQKISNGEYRF